MKDSNRDPSRDLISTSVMGAVLGCHDRAFHILGGMVHGVLAQNVPLDPEAVLPALDKASDFGMREESGIHHLQTSPRVSIASPWNGRIPLEQSAVRHLEDMMAIGLDGRLAYLSEAGMDDNAVERLVSLVVGWVDEAGLGRLGGLLRSAAHNGMAPGHVLTRWLDGRCQLQLALLLDESAVGDSDLATAYAVSYAAELVIASYLSDVTPEQSIALVSGDDPDEG